MVPIDSIKHGYSFHVGKANEEVPSTCLLSEGHQVAIGVVAKRLPGPLVGKRLSGNSQSVVLVHNE